MNLKKRKRSQPAARLRAQVGWERAVGLGPDSQANKVLPHAAAAPAAVQAATQAAMQAATQAAMQAAMQALLREATVDLI